MHIRTAGPLDLCADGLVISMNEYTPHEHEPTGAGVGLLVRWMSLQSGFYEDCILTAPAGCSTYVEMTCCRPGDIVSFEGRATVLHAPGLINDTALVHKPTAFRITRRATQSWQATKQQGS